jgi:hypothetical protein
MEDNLKEFTAAHREDFDIYEPSATLWQRIETGIPPAPVKRMVASRIRIWQVAVAAAIVGFAFFLMTGLPGRNNKQRDTGIVKKNVPVTAPTLAEKETAAPTPEAPSTQKMSATGIVNTVPKKKYFDKKRNLPVDVPLPDTDPLNTYAVNKKQERVVQSILKKEAPVLHERFSEDLAALQKQYALFEKELKKNTNRDQLIGAMQRNLEMQNELVNRQLNVIKEIKQLKNSKNEYPTRKIT